jgi:DNA repair protein RadC
MEQLELFKHERSPPVKKPLGPREWKVVSLRECPTPESMIKMECPQDALNYWNRHIAGSPQFNPDCECVAVLVLNTKLRIKGHYIVSVGSLNEAMVTPMGVFRLAILAAAYQVVLMHNHPSGESDPSSADRDITRRVREAGQLLRIDLCDHVIVGHQRYFSFRECGML